MIPALDRMGADLEAALRRSPRRPWWRAHPAIALLAVVAVVAAPAAGSRVDWAGLVSGETALPTQAGSGVRTLLASGDRYRADAWQLVVYKARIASADGAGPVGLCSYVALTIDGTGAGRCARTAERAPELLVSSRGDGTGVIAGLVSARAARVELTLADGRRLALAPQTLDAATASRRGLPDGLRFFVVDVAEFGRARLRGARVRDAVGHELARSGRPRAVPASAPLLQSPVSISPEEVAP